MKKILTTILALFYLASSTGATIHVHFCMGKFRSVSLLDPKEEGCSFCGMKKKKGCCEDKHAVVKMEKKYDNVINSHSLKIIPPLLPGHFISVFIAALPAPLPIDCSSSGSPPEKTGVPLFIRNCVYLI